MEKIIESLLQNADTLIFDFDGTLLNSEPYHMLAHSKVLSIIVGREINLSKKDFERYIGKKDTEIFDLYKQDFKVDFDKDEMIMKKVNMARDLLVDKNVEIFDYFFELVKKKNNKKFYIVSNQHENILFPVLEAKGIKKYFESIFCLSKMNVAKKDFYENIKTFIPSAKNILVFEDNAKTIKMLIEKNYNVVGIENEMNYKMLLDIKSIIQINN